MLHGVKTKTSKIYAVQIKVEHDILHITEKENFKLRLSLSLVYFSADNFHNLPKRSHHTNVTAKKGKVTK